jgi:hypothetical protein
MFCPQCKAEHRSGFTRCSDCDVDLVEELPAEPSKESKLWRILQAKASTQDSVEWSRTKSLIKSVLAFVVHQFIGTYGIVYTAPLVFSLAFKFPFLLGHPLPQRKFYAIVSELPYFSVQIIFALILGWLLGRVLRHRSIVWVWMLPLAILCYSVASAKVLNPTSVLASPGIGQSRFSHYFGWGCRPADRCLDELLITMPFYSSLAYSLGAALARKTLGYAYSQSNRHLQAVTAVGLVVVAASVIDLGISTQQSGWHNLYLLLLATPTGLGALLLYFGFSLRRQRVSSA